MTSVSETVILTIPINSSLRDMEAGVVSSGSSVQMTVSGNGAKSRVIRVPLLVRSNVGFNVSGILESNTVLRTQFSVIGVRATGKLVSPEAIDNLEIPQEFDMRGRKDADSPKKGVSNLEISQPFLLLSGPRVSLGGTLESPNNALQITVLIRITPQSTGDWQIHLTFSGDKRAVESNRKTNGCLLPFREKSPLGAQVRQLYLPELGKADNMYEAAALRSPSLGGT